MIKQQLSEEQLDKVLDVLCEDLTELRRVYYSIDCRDAIQQLRQRVAELEVFEDWDQNWSYCPSCDRPTKPSMMDDAGYEESCCKLCLESDYLRSQLAAERAAREQAERNCKTLLEASEIFCSALRINNASSVSEIGEALSIIESCKMATQEGE